MGGSSIMASAGRVLPLPKGAYSSSTTYHLLDFVSYQGSTYICKQTSTGNAPTNTTYWQIMAQGTESASVAGNYYGTCSTGASTSAKIVSIPATENFVLQVGDIIGIKFDNTNTANNPSLNVNNSGAKPIYYNNSAVSTSNLWASGEANRVTIFMYDGTNWIWIGHDVDIDTDTLSDLKDTTISSASNGQVLMYDSTSSKWKNQTPTTTLEGLTDTQIASLSNGQVLKYDSASSKWVNADNSLSDLSDANISSATNGQSLIYNSTSQKWENGNEKLSNLSDANISSASNKNILQFNSTSNKWENKALYKVLTATLTAGQTTVTFTDNFIVSDSMCELQVVGGTIIAPTAITDNSANHSVTYTFDAQSSDVSFKLLVLNI